MVSANLVQELQNVTPSPSIFTMIGIGHSVRVCRWQILLSRRTLTTAKRFVTYTKTDSESEEFDECSKSQIGKSNTKTHFAIAEIAAKFAICQADSDDTDDFCDKLTSLQTSVSYLQPSP